MFSKLARSRIKALGADPEELGRMRDCAADRARPTDYFGLGCRHERRLACEVSSGQWHLACSCGAFGLGDSLPAAVDAWNEHCLFSAESSARVAARRSRAPNVVALKRKRGD
jgi:hypothetical protein